MERTGSRILYIWNHSRVHRRSRAALARGDGDHLCHGGNRAGFSSAVGSCFKQWGYRACPPANHPRYTSVRRKFRAVLQHNSGREIDFRAEKNNKVYLIQVAYSVAEEKAYDREFCFCWDR